MKENTKTYFNLIITILLIAASVAWMITVASQGEIVTYNRELVINTLDIDVDIYQYNYETLTYDLIVASPIVISNMAPNDTRNFKMEITNNGDTIASTSIVLSNITGDITDLGPSLYFGSTNPIVKEINLQTTLETTTSGNSMVRFFDNFKINPLETKKIYWYIRMDKTATNEVADKTLSIANINFIKP